MTDLSWNATEEKKAQLLSSELAAWQPVQQLTTGQRKVELNARDTEGLEVGIHVSVAAGRVLPEVILLRHLYRLLHFDESLPFRWRLEHKLVQALILNHFVPGCTPITVGLSRFVDHAHVERNARLARLLQLYVIKPALGYGRQPTLSSTNIFCNDEPFGATINPEALADERWIIQERLAIEEEYRVHTLEASVVDNLTFLRHSTRSIRSEREGPNAYVRDLLERLPCAFTSQSICGWDIARLGDGSHRVVEVNFGGFHPKYARGFQCSGFLSQQHAGPYLLAKLMLFIERKYSIEFSFRESPELTTELEALYYLLNRWTSLLRSIEPIRSIGTSHKSTQDQAVRECFQRYAASLRTLTRVSADFTRLAEFIE